MVPKKWLGLFSLFLLVSAFIIVVSTESGYCLGDNLLRGLGLKAWSKESAQRLNLGFHYTVILFVALAVPGYIGVKKFWKESFPAVVERLFLIFIALLFFATPIFNWGYGTFLSFSDGVRAVDYLSAQSECKYVLHPETGAMSCTYYINLKNYSKEPVTFNIQVERPRLRSDNSVMAAVTETDSQGQDILQEFLLAPQAQQLISFVLENQDDSYETAVNGSMRGPRIIISDKESSRAFMVR